jgi:hypothetical protein
MRYRFIDEQKKAWPVSLMCGILCVSRRGYDDWTERGLSRRVRSNSPTDKPIREIFTSHWYRYGAPRIADALDKGSKNRITQRIRRLGLKAIYI